MAVKRQDAWTPDDDLVLAEVTLRHIREGSTQLAAFEEVAEKLEEPPPLAGFVGIVVSGKNTRLPFRSPKPNVRSGIREVERVRERFRGSRRRYPPWIRSFAF